MGKTEPQKKKGRFGVSRNVFVLGWVSFLTDLSSDMIFTTLPLFLMNVLGVGAAFIGFIEGMGDSAATLLKVGSGWASDRLGRRKWLTVAGYALSTIAKPFLLLASSGGAVLGIRIVERAGKGIRTSPRDALIADSTTPETMGRGFGFHRALDTLGAVLGIAVAAGVVYVVLGSERAFTEAAFHWLVIIGIIPAVLSVLLLVFFVREAKVPQTPMGEAVAGGRHGSGLGKRFKIFLAVMVIFTLGNPATAFVILRADGLGLSPFHILLLLVLFNLLHAAASYPAGRISDRLGRKRVIVAGWAVYSLAYLGFALAGAAWHIIALFALYGLYYGIVEGASRAFVADMVSKDRRGTAYGLFHGSIGISLLLASVIAGALWQWVGPSAPFFFGAAMAGLAMVGMAFFVKELHISVK
ncbi:MAG: MFS transporter [Chloroflexota bacterium]|nr:MFS transporter [Chloroflexota bacterium]